MESVTRVVPKDDFSLELWFDDGTHRLFDVKPYLERGVFTRLKDPIKFRQTFVACDFLADDGVSCCQLETLLHVAIFDV